MSAVERAGRGPTPYPNPRQLKKVAGKERDWFFDCQESRADPFSLFRQSHAFLNID
jgi:hypothetical protein